MPPSAQLVAVVLDGRNALGDLAWPARVILLGIGVPPRGGDAGGRPPLGA